ncbi:PIN domain-containing protein [Gordonia sp. WA4-43]|uniref:PIN domain-containing protein n=1 Tax=Gordonia sp. WA4-43 TaxID=2878678 RepID=UPI001CF9BA29|nr:PIN domain-containing protein [Gordonia sp. WA4-43]UCZ89107.1 PIN domain-containing protein [Gordonia sp. WA4-43]
MSHMKVVLDACVMLPQNLNNVLLTLAEREMFTPIWTDALLGEVERNLVAKLGVSPEQARHRIEQMRIAFPFAEDEAAGYERLVDAMTNDPKDRHVAAAAVRSGAALIVTANLKDFPQEALDPFGVEAIHPDEFLFDQLDLDRGRVLDALELLVARNRRTPKSLPELMDALVPLVPRFASSVMSLIASPILAVEETTDDEMTAAEFPGGGPTPYTPFGAAVLWKNAIDNHGEFPVAVARLCTPDLGLADRASEASEHLTGYGMASWVHDSRGRQDVAYIKFIPDPGVTGRVFAPTLLTDVHVLELHRGQDGWWRAHALHLDTMPRDARSTGRPDTERESER